MGSYWVSVWRGKALIHPVSLFWFFCYCFISLNHTLYMHHNITQHWNREPCDLFKIQFSHKLQTTNTWTLSGCWTILNVIGNAFIFYNVTFEWNPIFFGRKKVKHNMTLRKVEKSGTWCSLKKLGNLYDSLVLSWKRSTMCTRAAMISRHHRQQNIVDKYSCCRVDVWSHMA